MRYKIYTYKNVEEYNKLYSELEEYGEEIHIFKFQQTGELLEDNQFVTIDITYVVEYLMYQNQDTMAVINNFEYLTENSKIIIKESLAETALELLYSKFYDIEKLYKEKQDNKEKQIIKKLDRRLLYTYKDINHLNNIIDYCDRNKIHIISISDINDDIVKGIDRKLVVDLTSVIMLIEHNKSIVYNMEQVLKNLNDYIPLVKEDLSNISLETFPHIFNQSCSVEKIFNTTYSEKNEYKDISEKNSVCLIVDKNMEEISDLYNYIDNRLVGHTEFKKELVKKIKSFIALKKINQKKILSIFLLGPSGVGKTEVARIIKDYLNEKTSLIKLNFGNYSSQDSLNNIIGSPRGYIGCEEGELGSKITKSKAGVVICDEFEKADFSIFNFFLQLLEDGIFTDTMGKEYDLDGYIIVFTSNLTEKEYYNTISPELQSRFDLVCKFENLSSEDKLEFVKKEISRLLEKVNMYDEREVCFKDILRNINIQGIDNIREIKRVVQDEFVKIIDAELIK